MTFILGFVVSRVLVARKHRDLRAERARGLEHSDAKEWDKAIAPVLGLGFGVIVLVLRTKLEDDTLQSELGGYREYAARTRYRLLPGVW